MKENIKIIFLFLLILTIVGCKIYDIISEEIDAAEAALNYNFCIKTAESEHDNDWNIQCDMRGEPDNCILPTDNAVILAEIANANKIGCLRFHMK